MIYRKEIISALEYLIEEDCTETQHDYVKEIKGAIDLLREQETKPYNWMLLEHEYALCAACDMILQQNYKYCPGCGRRIKWDAAD